MGGLAEEEGFSDYGSDDIPFLSAVNAGMQAPGRRRMAVIPLDGATRECDTLPVPKPGLVQPSSSSLFTLGAVSTALVCLGCAVKRRFAQLKQAVRRDSFGFLPDAQRTSLNAADINV